MLISNKYNFIFIHIYKNAGTSISAALVPHITSPLQYLLSNFFQKIGYPLLMPQPYPRHSKAKELVRYMGHEKFSSYFSFAITRNPWDWQVSLYTYALKNKNHPQHAITKKFASFDDYINWRCKYEVRSQTDFIFDEQGSQLVTFVGKYESIEKDFDHICTKIGIQTTLPKLNISKSRPYQSYYTKKSRTMVQEFFQTDIELFGYRFDEQ